MRRIVFIAPLTIAALGLGQIAPCPLGARALVLRMRVEKEREADLLGNGQSYGVQWFVRGPLPPDCPRCPPDWVRGIEVRKVVGKPRIIASWASPRTSIQTFYPELNRLWQTSSGDLISVAVQYGGRVMDVFMLRLEGNVLREAWHWAGMNATVLRLNDRLVLKVQSDDYFQPPRLYAWTGKRFGDVSPDFPSFYEKRGESDAKAIRDTTFTVSSPGVLVNWCRQALADFQLAKQRDLGREACREAIQRVESGRGLARSPVDKSPEAFEQDKRHVVRQLEALIRGATQSQ